MALRYNRLKFFNKKGIPINLKYDFDKQVWYGNLHIPEVSIGLFENETIYILEEFENLSSVIVNGTPHIFGGSAPELTADFMDKEDSINLFVLDNLLNQKPEIQITEKLILQVDVNIGDSYDTGNNRVISGNIKNNALRIDISANAQTEGNYTRILRIKDEAGDIASIEVYFEAIGEDERFNVWLQNLCGQMPIKNSEFYIFRNADINEDLLDYKILNNKRKELLIEYKNILPYIAGYKGLVNVIKFFGYYDLRLKEYWHNEQTGKKFLEEVKLFEDQNLDKIPTQNVKPLVKTSMFALYYDIVREKKDEFDEFGIPKTEKAFQYTQEEILIKLFGLKNYIETNDIGGMASIVDIVGEYVVYQRYTVKNWNERTHILAFESNQIPNFSVDKNFGYIYDLRLDNEDGCTAPKDWNSLNNPGLQIAAHSDCLVAYFNPYNRTLSEVEYSDEPNIPVGFKIKLKNESFNLSWKDAHCSWLDTAYQNILITWANFESLHITDIGWTVKYVSELNDPTGRRFVYNKRGSKPALATQDVILPFIGEYDVTLTLYGYNGEITSFTKRKHINLAIPNADAVSFFRYYDYDLQYWSTNHLSWKDLNNQWKRPVYDNRNYSVEDVKIRFRSFKMVEWLDLEDTDNAYVGTNSPSWSRDETATWNDFKYVTWKQLVFERERLAKFLITELKAGGTIQVGKDLYQFPNDLNSFDFKIAADLLNSQTGADISSFSYFARPINSPTYIDCVSKFEDDFGDKFIGSKDGVEVLGDILFEKWKDFKIAWKDEYLLWSMTTKYFVRSIINPFNKDDVRLYHSAFSVPTMVPVFFVHDSSAIAGKTTIKWTIMDNFGNEIVSLVNKNLCFTFIAPGFYSLIIDITDTNGNRNVNKKINLIEVKQTDNFKALN